MRVATKTPEIETEASEIVTKSPIPKLAYSPKEVAQALGINSASAYDLFHRADFPAIRISQNRMVVPVAALEQWLMTQSQKT